MKKEEKQLLIKDLCARLPYSINVLTEDNDKGHIIGVDDTENGVFEIHIIEDGDSYTCDESIENFKPYLRPMDSMTEEELNECAYQSGIKDIECPNWQDIPKEKQFETRLNHAIAVFLTDSNNVDWLNARRFDYRGLISMGLALKAPKGMYKPE